MTGGDRAMCSIPLPGARGRRRMNRAGTSLVEVIIAVALVGVGIAGVASVTATAARVLVRTGALDETHALLQGFVDSVAAAPERGAESGSRAYPVGVLAWSVPRTPGAAAWVSFGHDVLPDAIRVDFVVPASLPAAPATP